MTARRAAVLSALLVGVALRATAAEDPTDFEKILPGQSLVVPAPIGVTPEVLGLGFDEHLNDLDAAGKRHRAFTAKSTRVAVNQYSSEFEQLDNEFKLQAHARVLGTRLGAGFSKTNRYLILRAYQLKEVVSLEPEGDPLEAVPVMAAKIYYGWAVNVVFEGAADEFTLDVANELLLPGASLELTIKQHHLKTYIQTLGVEPKVKGSIKIARDQKELMEQFTVADTPEPIFIEYKVVKEFFSPKVTWSRGSFVPGKYRLTAVRVVANETKSNGRHWDALGDPPDLFVKVKADDQAVFDCFLKNRYEGICAGEKVLELKDATRISIQVLDRDLMADDPLGAAAIDDVFAAGRPYEEIEATTTGQLQKATITLVPVQARGAPVAPQAPP